MVKTLLLKEPIICDERQIRNVLNAIKDGLNDVPINGVMHLDLSLVRHITLHAAEALVRLICKRPKNKKIYLFKGGEQVVKIFEFALFKRQRATLWINQNKDVKPIGKFVSGEKFKLSGYQGLLDFITEKKYVTTKDVSIFFKWSHQSLANYKLDKLYEWSLVDRERILVPSGGTMYLYSPINLEPECELALD